MRLVKAGSSLKKTFSESGWESLLRKVGTPEGAVRAHAVMNHPAKGPGPGEFNSVPYRVTGEAVNIVGARLSEFKSDPSLRRMVPFHDALKSEIVRMRRALDNMRIRGTPDKPWDSERVREGLRVLDGKMKASALVIGRAGLKAAAEKLLNFGAEMKGEIEREGVLFGKSGDVLGKVGNSEGAYRAWDARRANAGAGGRTPVLRVQQFRDQKAADRMADLRERAGFRHFDSPGLSSVLGDEPVYPKGGRPRDTKMGRVTGELAGLHETAQLGLGRVFTNDQKGDYEAIKARAGERADHLLSLASANAEDKFLREHYSQRAKAILAAIKEKPFFVPRYKEEKVKNPGGLPVPVGKSLSYLSGEAAEGAEILIGFRKAAKDPVQARDAALRAWDVRGRNSRGQAEGRRVASMEGGVQGHIKAPPKYPGERVYYEGEPGTAATMPVGSSGPTLPAGPGVRARIAGQLAAARRAENAAQARGEKPAPPPKPPAVSPGISDTAQRPPIPEQRAVGSKRAMDDAEAKGVKDVRLLAENSGIARIGKAGDPPENVIVKYRHESGLAKYEGRGEDIRGRGNIRDSEMSEAKRELAAFEVDRELGLGVTPEVRALPKGEAEGHMMAFVDGMVASKVKAELVSDARDGSGHPDLHRIAALDIITGNADRHMGNFMKGRDGRYYAVDNGISFGAKATGGFVGIRSVPAMYLAGKEIPKEIRERVAKLTPARFNTILARQGAPPRLINAAQKRLKALQKMTHWPGYEEWDNAGFLRPGKSLHRKIAGKE